MTNLIKFQSWLQQQYDLSERTRQTYLARLNRIDLNQLANSLLSLRDSVKDKTFNLTITALRCYARFLNEEYPTHALISRIQKLKKIKSPVSTPHPPYSVEETEQILSAAKGWRRTALYIAFYAALRQEEIENLNVNNIDVEKKTITVVAGKGNKTRVVVISDILIDMLKTWIHIRSLNAKVGGPQLLFTRLGTRPRLHSGSVLKVLSKQTGINVSWHRARATYATMLYKKSKDTMLVKEQLGHASIRTTDSYIQRSLEEVKSEIQKLGDIYG